MNRLLTLITFHILNISYGQNFEETLPKNYQKITESKGDLDKDGIDEIVFVYNTDKEIGDLGFERELYICKTAKGKTKLWKKNNSILWKSKDGRFNPPNGLIVSLEIRNNTLIVKQTFNSNSRHFQTYKNTFRYQNNDWFLIGSNCIYYDTCGLNYEYDINFSTKKVIVKEEHPTCDENDDVTQKNYYNTFKYNFSEIPKMDGFMANEHQLKIPNTNKYFFY